MQRKEKTFSTNFKVGYLMALTVKIIVFAVCIFIIALTPADFLSKAQGGTIAFVIFLALSFRVSRSLEKISKKEGMNNVEWLMILSAFVVIVMILALVVFIPPAETFVYLISVSMIAGFAAGIIAAELIFVSRVMSVGRMKRYNLIVSSILIAILVIPLSAPGFLAISNNTVQTKVLPEILAYTNTINPDPDAVNIETTTITETANIEGVEVAVSVTKYLLEINGTEYTKVKATCHIEGRYFLMETPFMELNETIPTGNMVMPPTTLNETSPSEEPLVAGYPVNGTIIKEPLIVGHSKAETTPLVEPLVVEHPVRYVWDGNVTFISTDSEPLYVKYDHPDNGPYSPPTYDIPPNEKHATTMRGYTRGIGHLPIHIIKDAKTKGTLVFGVTAILTSIIWVLAGIPEAIGTKIAAGILALVEGIIVGMGIVFNWFIDTVITSELDDGWTYMWGFGSFWIFRWAFISWGAWRDIGWFVMWVDPGDPVGPSIGYVDNYLIINTPSYLLIGGFGEDTYGCHAAIDASIWPTCYVADTNGNPLEGIKVEFTLTCPGGQTITFAPVYTDSGGLAQIGFALNASVAPKGIYNIKAIVDGTLEDTTAFSYKSCLLFLGYTYDTRTVYIENVYLLDEGAVYQVIAYPPPGYKLNRWIINFMHYAYGNPIYVELYIDAFVIAHFVWSPSDSQGGGRKSIPMLC